MPPFSPREDTNLRSSFPLKRLTPTELKERCEKGLCYNCNERFVPGHRYKKLFVIEAYSEEEDNDSDMELEELEEIETPGISLHAMRGRDGPETMRVAGLIQAIPTTILLDSRSSHNFVSESLARKLQLHPVKGPRIRSDGGFRLVMLKGLTDQVIEGYELEKEVGVHPVGALVQLLAIESQNYTAAKGVAAPELQKILETFQDIFKEPMGLPPNRAHDHCIPLQPGSQLVCSKPYRHPYYQKSEIERLVTELLSTGVIRPGNSPFSSPVILVKKHDGTWRMCVDYRALNRITIKDKFPIPIIDELLDELHGAKFFSKLDLRSGYHQIRVQASDIPKTAFRTHHGHFEFLVMPFGLTNAPSTFQSLMNEIFKNQLRRYVLVFFYDILVYSTNWEDHLKHLETTLAILKNHNLFAKLGKCEFGQMSVRYLGHIISHEGVCVDLEKISAMVEWPQPCSTRAMRGFLGLTGYYRKFIQDYGKIAAPLTQMLRKNSFNWSEKAVASFEKLKVSMTQAPVLALPDFSLQFVKEMLALVMAVLKWKHYLLGRKFVVRTDQRSLQYLWSQKIATEAQQKWLYKLMGFDFSIEYKRGSENKVVDALSRRTEGPNEEQLMAFSSPVPHWVDAIREEQQVRSQLQQLIQRVQSGEAVGPWEVRDGLLLFKDRIYVDTDSPLKQDIINQFHASSHEGFHKTFQRVHSNFYWLKMREDIKTFIRECEICQKHKVKQLSPAGLLQPLPIPHKVWEDISMDFVEGLPISQGKSTIMVVVDRFSKYSHFIAIAHPYTAVSIAQVFFENIFKLHGMPRTIVCDRDVTFTSGFWTELFRLNGTSFNFSSAYHPQTDGQTEVVNRTLEMYLRCFTSDKPKQWVRWLCWAEFCYNTSWHSAIKRTPFEVVYGREPPSLLTYVPGTAKVAAVEDELLQRDLVLTDLKENIKVAQERMKRSYDSKHREKNFEVSNWVYLRLRPYRQVFVAMQRNAKLSPWFYGPFRILQRIGQVAYKLELPSDTRIHPVFHVLLLKEKLGSKISVQSQLPITIGDHNELRVRPMTILDRRKRRNVEEVLVQWQGLPTSEATWENLTAMKSQFPEYALEDKGHRKGKGV
uniref:Reverse transcriptase n=1 Tax=Fagus sylvatica TaxID=28930 RepID=A0A2N9H624_FAGSY